MRPYRVIDPRSPLDRVNRDQMREFAERNGITEITWDMSGDEMKFLLKKRGITDIGAPFQILGTHSNMVVRADNDPTVPTMSLEDLQRQQWEQRAKERQKEQETIDVRNWVNDREGLAHASLRGPRQAEVVPAPKKRGRPKKVTHGQSHAS